MFFENWFGEVRFATFRQRVDAIRMDQGGMGVPVTETVAKWRVRKYRPEASCSDAVAAR